MAQPACNAPTEAAAFLWNLRHGGFRSSPQNTPDRDWPLYSDPSMRLLTFSYPPTWQVTDLRTYGQVGVLLTSADQSSAFEILLQVSAGQGISALQVAEQGLQSLIGAAVEPLCTDSFPGDGVMTNEIGVVVARSGDLVVFAATQVFHTSGFWQADFGAVVAPASQFDAVTYDVILPIFVHLFKNADPDNQTMLDSDGDGVRDQEDGYAYDPTRH